MHNNLPKQYYFIEKFDKKILENQSTKTAIIYRNYSKKINKIEILKLREFCNKKKLRLILSNNFKLALKLNLDGTYIPSFNKSFNHLNFSLKKNFIILGSAHNLKEIRIKELQKVDAIFLSSIFKKNNNYLGLFKFLNLSSLSKKNVIALGGISQKNKKRLYVTNLWGFAGISYFK
jgi:thiamine-phosphate pyrophosphorylase|tara:strand:- start:59 stop:586 length:528 start_codon:yes stop_codon:yes gene_type:complete